MASGFIIIKDGRYFSNRWTIYVYIIELIIKELSLSEKIQAIDFKNWLETRVPKEEDIINGFGGFIRHSNHENVQCDLDLRELTNENQELFWNAVQKILTKIITNEELKRNQEDFIWLLKRMLKMKHLADIGDNPANLNDSRGGYIRIPNNEHIGPGW